MRSPEDPADAAPVWTGAGGAEVSFLWPPGSAAHQAEGEARLSPDQAADLELEMLVSHLCLHGTDRPLVRSVLEHLCADPRVISYRHGILETILSSNSMTERLEALLPKIDKLRQHHIPREKGELLHEVAWRLGELEIFVECVRDMAGLLDGVPPESLSEGFRAARNALGGLLQSELMRHLGQELPKLLSEVRGTRSVTIGVNVDQDLQPSSVTLLSVNRYDYGERSSTFLRRLFGAGAAEAGGIAPLHHVPVDAANPMLVPLFRDLSDALARSLRPVATALQRFMALRTHFLDQWGQELSFYLGAARLTRRLLAAGLPLCRPRVTASPAECRVEGCYNVVLALRLAEKGREGDLSTLIVRNDVSFGPHEVSILTGPNQGGKTTFMRAVGLAQVMCQAGLHVPGSRASLGAVDGIYTHFPGNERGDLDTGRFADEMKRLGDVFALATPSSLILLNESLTATSPRESLELARELVGALQMLGARALYTTHQYELAAEVAEFNAHSSGAGRVASLVAASSSSFRIEHGPPAGSSRAREVAARYGIGYEQLVDVLRRRGIV